MSPELTWYIIESFTFLFKARFERLDLLSKDFNVILQMICTGTARRDPWNSDRCCHNYASNPRQLDTLTVPFESTTAATIEANECCYPLISFLPLRIPLPLFVIVLLVSNEETEKKNNKIPIHRKQKRRGGDEYCSIVRMALWIELFDALICPISSRVDDDRWW